MTSKYLLILRLRGDPARAVEQDLATNATDRTVEIRALVSSTDSSLNWDLRCAVREHLLEFVQRLEGGYLPRTRLEPPAFGLAGDPGGPDGTPRARGSRPSEGAA